MLALSRPHAVLLGLRSTIWVQFALFEDSKSRPRIVILALRSTLAVFVKVIFIQLVDRLLL